MIATLAGRLRRKLEDRVIVECGGLGYEVFLPPIAQRQLEHVTAGPGEKGSEIELVIYYHATRDQPRPVLIGFSRKSSLGRILGDPHATVGTRDASVGVAVAAYERGATLIRAHDVRAHAEALRAAQAVYAS